MKVALCISGLCEVDTENGKTHPSVCVDALRNTFAEADVYFGVWSSSFDSFKEIFPLEEAWQFKDRHPSYHPYTEAKIEEPINPKFNNMISHCNSDKETKDRCFYQTNQMFAHAHMVENLPLDYDVIIRTRYDCLPVGGAALKSQVVKAYEEEIAIGNAFKHLGNTDVTSRYPNFLFDHIIVHHKNAFDIQALHDLDRARKLRAAEYGWWQIMNKVNPPVCIAGLADSNG